MTQPDRGIIPIKNALVSVSDKTGLFELGLCLATSGVTILSTGGTARFLREKGCEVIDVAQVTGFPEIMDGRVKTLHPQIFGRILGRIGEDDAVMSEHRMLPIDLVVVNLYPFAETVAGGKSFEACVEQIDIGGPSLIRAAAKNHERVTVVTDPKNYPRLVHAIDNEGGVDLDTRRRLAALAYSATARYDEAIARWMFEKSNYTDFLSALPAAA